MVGEVLKRRAPSFSVGAATWSGCAVDECTTEECDDVFCEEVDADRRAAGADLGGAGMGPKTTRGELGLRWGVSLPEPLPPERVLALEQEHVNVHREGEEIARLGAEGLLQIGTGEFRCEEVGPEHPAQEPLAIRRVGELHGVTVEEGHLGSVGDNDVGVVEVADDHILVVEDLDPECQVRSGSDQVLPGKPAEPRLRVGRRGPVARVRDPQQSDTRRRIDTRHEEPDETLVVGDDVARPREQHVP
jgi:hypothetical protein